MLSALSNLGVVATRVINETKDNTVADLASLVPTLQKLAQAGTYLPRALEVLLDYPFPRNATNAIFGDYTGLMADIDLNASVQNLANLTSLGLPVPPSGSNAKTAPKPGSTLPKLPPLPKAPPLPKLPPLPGPLSPQQQTNQSTSTLMQLLMGGLQ